MSKGKCKGKDLNRKESSAHGTQEERKVLPCDWDREPRVELRERIKRSFQGQIT